MSLRIIEISAPDTASEKIQELAERYHAIDCWHSARQSWFNKKEDKRETTRILVDVQNQQDLMDALHQTVNKNDDWRIILIPIEATLPRPDPEEQDEEEKSRLKRALNKLHFRNILRGSVTREELWQDMDRGGRITFDFILLVFLSTIVAAIGLIQSDVAIIIGAMVIAPLLGPNLSLAFGAALGDRNMISNSIKTNIVGVGFTLLIATLMGYFIPEATVHNSTELINRTDVSYSAIALALAAGAAAVLSLTTGVSSGLVGVMVAVALMPPAVALGLTIGNAQWSLAYGTTLLLATNVVCINLAAQAIFRFKGIRPRTWYEEKQAKKASRTNTLIWLILLIILAGLIYLKQTHMAEKLEMPSLEAIKFD